MAQNIKVRQRPPCMMRGLKCLLQASGARSHADGANLAPLEARQLGRLLDSRPLCVHGKTAGQTLRHIEGCVRPCRPLGLKIGVRWRHGSYEPVKKPLVLNLFSILGRTVWWQGFSIVHEIGWNHSMSVNCPVTAAVIRARRRSWRSWMESRSAASSPAVRSRSALRWATMARCSSSGGTGSQTS